MPGRSLTSIAARLKRARESEEQQRRERTRATPGARLVSEAPAVLQQREVLASLPPNRQTTGSAGEKAIRIESDEARIAAALLSLQRAEQRQPPPAARIVPLLSGARGGAGMGAGMGKSTMHRFRLPAQIANEAPPAAGAGTATTAAPSSDVPIAPTRHEARGRRAASSRTSRTAGIEEVLVVDNDDDDEYE